MNIGTSGGYSVNLIGKPETGFSLGVTDPEGMEVFMVKLDSYGEYQSVEKTWELVDLIGKVYRHGQYDLI